MRWQVGLLRLLKNHQENQKYLCPPYPRGLNQNKLTKNDRSGIYPEESRIDSHCDQNPFKLDFKSLFSKVQTTWKRLETRN